MAVVINLSDPGAVPGGSTQAQAFVFQAFVLLAFLGLGGAETGSTRA